MNKQHRQFSKFFHVGHCARQRRNASEATKSYIQIYITALYFHCAPCIFVSASSITFTCVYSASIKEPRSSPITIQLVCMMMLVVVIFDSVVSIKTDGLLQIPTTSFFFESAIFPFHLTQNRIHNNCKEKIRSLIQQNEKQLNKKRRLI